MAWRLLKRISYPWNERLDLFSCGHATLLEALSVRPLVRWSVTFKLIICVWGCVNTWQEWLGVGLGWGWRLDAPVHPSATILWPRVTCSLRFLIAWRTFVWELDVALQYNVSFKSCISRINQWTSWKRHAQAVVDVLLVSCPSVQCIRWSLVLAGWSFRSCLQNYIFCIRWTDWSLHWLVQLANSTNFDTLSKRRQRIDRLV